MRRRGGAAGPKKGEHRTQNTEHGQPTADHTRRHTHQGRAPRNPWWAVLHRRSVFRVRCPRCRSSCLRRPRLAKVRHFRQQIEEYTVMEFNLAEINEAIAAAIPERDCIVTRDRRLTW